MAASRTSRLSSVLVLFALVACGGGDAEGRSMDPAAAPGADAASGAATAARGLATDSLEVTLEGQPFAGTHRVAGELGCMMYGGVWQASYEVQDATGLSGMLVQLKDVPATGGSTDQLTLSIVFGQMDDMTGNAGVVDVVGSEQSGDARGTVTREGNAGAVIRIEGTAQHGARVTTVLRCAKVEFLQ